jgi:hypothetical protein
MIHSPSRVESGKWLVENDFLKTTFYFPQSTFHLWLSGPFKDFPDTPPFLFAQGTGFDQQDLISDMALILFVVGLHLRPLPDIFLIDRVTDEAIDHDHDRLIHFIARDDARERFAFASLFRWHIPFPFQQDDRPSLSCSNSKH